MLDAAGLGYRLPYHCAFYDYPRPYPAVPGVRGALGPAEERGVTRQPHEFALNEMGGFPVPLRAPAGNLEDNKELPHPGLQRLDGEPEKEDARNGSPYVGHERMLQMPQQRYYISPQGVPIAFHYPNTSALPYPYNPGKQARVDMRCGNGEDGRERIYFKVDVNRDYYDKLYSPFRVAP